MRYRLLLIFLPLALTFSCSEKAAEFDKTALSESRFFARIETTSDPTTKVYADDKLRVLWDAEDRVSIFNKYTYNQEYRFAGNTGDNSGSFSIVQNDDFVTGNELDRVYAVYPYQSVTSINNDGVLSIVLPAEQTYRESSFGRGANTMVSCTTDNQLLFKNVCGYLGLKLYGENASVSSVSLKGNKEEPLAGTASVVSATDATPSLSFTTQTTTEITLLMNEPVQLGATAENATVFWLVIPPVSFEEGFTLTVRDNNGNSFEKATTKPFSISRNTLSRMSALKVNLENTSEPVEATLEEIANLADETTVKTKPVQVMAKTKRGFILADNTRTLFLYSKTGLEGVTVGDIIQVTSTFTHYRQLPELSGIESIEKISSGDTPAYPTPTDITDRSDFDDDFFKDFQYIRLNGTLQSIRSNDIGISYFVERSTDDELLPFNIFYPSDYQDAEGHSVGDLVWAEGYFAGFNSTDICIIITSMTIAPTGSYVDEYGVNYGQGITLNGLTWAPVNCGYKPATADSKGYPYGKLYQWGRKHGQGYGAPYYSDSDTYEDETVPVISATWNGKNEDADPNTFYYGSMTSSYTWIYTSDAFWNAGTEEEPQKNKSYDPCPRGWRVPTGTELSTLQNLSRSELTENNEVNGIWVSEVLFLPAGGGRFADKWSHRCGANGRGEGGSYWCSTLEGNNAVNMSLDGTVGSTYKAFGYAVRCVKDEIVPITPVIPVSSIVLDKTEVTLTEGESTVISATINPDNASDKTVTWQSSNSTVATVSNGIVTGISTGTATITATAGSKIATCSVTVIKLNNDTVGPTVVSYELTPTTVDVTDQDQTVTMTVHLTDETGVLSGFKASAYFPEDASGTMQKSDFQLVSGNKKDGSYKAVLTIKQGSVAGNWIVKLTSLKDELGNPAEEKTQQLTVVNNQSGTGTGGDWTDPGDD